MGISIGKVKASKIERWGTAVLDSNWDSEGLDRAPAGFNDSKSFTCTQWALNRVNLGHLNQGRLGRRGKLQKLKREDLAAIYELVPTRAIANSSWV